MLTYELMDTYDIYRITNYDYLFEETKFTVSVVRLVRSSRGNELKNWYKLTS